MLIAVMYSKLFDEIVSVLFISACKRSFKKNFIK